MKKLLLLLICLPTFLIAQDTDLDRYAKQASTAFDNDDFNSAVINYSKCIVLNPNSSVLYYMRGHSYRLGLDFENDNAYRDLDLAILDYNKALSIEESSNQDIELISSINFELGVCHLLLDDIDWCPFFVLSCDQGNSRACDSVKELCEADGDDESGE